MNAFELQHSDLNGFLFADIGVEAGGMDLSVVSALAREGVDPWQEAARLAKLPLAAAIEELARMIAEMPAGLWPQPVATVIATRLAGLLPRRDSGASAMAQKLSGAGMFGDAAGKDGHTGTAPEMKPGWLTLMLLVLAILVGSAIGMSQMAPNAEVEAAPAAAPPPLLTRPGPPAPPGGD